MKMSLRNLARMLRRRVALPTQRAIASRKTLNRAIGNLGEDLAVRELQRRNYRILERNFRCAAGEIDIIAEHDGHIAFVEVKARSPRALASPEEAVDDAKRKRIRNAAANYLLPYRQPSPSRFDIVAVLLDDQDRPIS